MFLADHLANRSGDVMKEAKDVFLKLEKPCEQFLE